MRDKRQESTVCGNRVWRAREVAELWRLRMGDGVEVEVEAGQGGKTPAPPAGQVDRRWASPRQPTSSPPAQNQPTTSPQPAHAGPTLAPSLLASMKMTTSVECWAMLVLSFPAGWVGETPRPREREGQILDFLLEILKQPSWMQQTRNRP